MKLIFWPNAILKVPSEDVKEPVEQAFLDEMRQIMRSRGGVGLSAIQVAVPKKIIVINYLDFILSIIHI
jgi:peptide deformylase